MARSDAHFAPRPDQVKSMHTTPDPQHYTASPSFLERLFGLRSPASQAGPQICVFEERAFEPPPAAPPPPPLTLTAPPVPPSLDALRLAVDTARADFTAALAGPVIGPADEAGKRYVRAATAYRRAQEKALDPVPVVSPVPAPPPPATGNSSPPSLGAKIQNDRGFLK